MAKEKLYRIEGLDDCLRFMDQVPDYLLKVTKAALKAGGKKGARILRQRVPPKWRRLVAFKLMKGQVTQDTYLMVGYFNKDRNRPGKYAGTSKAIPDWFKAYWMEYGTLARRDPNHHFDNPVRAKFGGYIENTIVVNGRLAKSKTWKDNYAYRRRRNDKGQFPEHIYEEASWNLEDEIYAEFCDYLKEHEYDLYG